MRIRLPRILRSPRGQSSPEDNNPPTEADGAQFSSDDETENSRSLEKLQLSEASQFLIRAEDDLFKEITEAEALICHKDDVDQHIVDYNKLKDHVVQTLQQSMCLCKEEPETLRSAVKTVCQEMEQDQLWKQRNSTPPSWRSFSWKALHDSTLHELVTERMETPSTPPAQQVAQSSIQTDINLMGRQLKYDLLRVVEDVKMCYPPEMNICNSYARMYHETFSSRLRKIADFGLAEKDCTFLLRWVNEFYPGILQKPELASEINTEALGKLLPKELLDPLEEQYLSKQESELTTYTSRILEEAQQRWNNGEEPKREDGCYVSPVAYDIIQFINGMVTSAEKVVGDLHKAQSLTCQLDVLMLRYKSFQDNIIKLNRADTKAYVKANLGCITQFRDFLIKRSRLFPEVKQKSCLHILAEMEQSAQMYLLSPVYESLKPQYRKLGTKDWLNKDVFQKLIGSIEKEIQDLKGSSEPSHQELMAKFHQDVTVEYVKRLLKGNIKLKDKNQQHQAYVLVKDNAESLHSLFSRMGSKEDWLKEILTKIAEVLKLQDLPAIQMQVVSLGSAFPDLSEKHISALLKLKINLSKEDRKTVKCTLSDTLKETTFSGAQSFFSSVQVK